MQVHSPTMDTLQVRHRDVPLPRRTPAGVRDLTDRQQEVLGLVAMGCSNAEIAAELFISVKTVGHHVSAVLQRLGVKSRTEAAALAHREGLVLGS